MEELVKQFIIKSNADFQGKECKKHFTDFMIEAVVFGFELYKNSSIEVVNKMKDKCGHYFPRGKDGRLNPCEFCGEAKEV